jgi:K+-sensing histidine kinase KdpD
VIRGRGFFRIRFLDDIIEWCVTDILFGRRLDEYNNHYRKRSLYRELGYVPRARSKALGTETLCREQRVQLSAQKKLAVQTYCAEREQSRLSAQTTTHGTEDLCRELEKRALGTAATSRRNVTAVTAVCPAVRCAESPLLALGTEHMCRVPAKGSRQRIKKNQIHTFKTFSSSTYTTTKSICSNFT